jgi:electron transport complex protein RnfG
LPVSSFNRVAAAAALLAAALPATAAPSEQVFLTREQALAKAFPSGEQVAERKVSLSDAQRRRVEKRLGWRLKEPWLIVHEGRRDGASAGYAVVAEEVGKHEPITFMLKAMPDLRVEWVEVMTYREPHGSEVRKRGFLRQFEGRGAGDRLRPGREIENITGATLSVKAMAAGVARVLCILEEVYGPPAR